MSSDGRFGYMKCPIPWKTYKRPLGDENNRIYCPKHRTIDKGLRHAILCGTCESEKIYGPKAHSLFVCKISDIPNIDGYHPAGFGFHLKSMSEGGQILQPDSYQSFYPGFFASKESTLECINDNYLINHGQT
jgi:hypothetical protein